MPPKISQTKGYPALPPEWRKEPVSVEPLSLMPADVIREFGAFVFAKDGTKIGIAAINPDSPTLRQYAESHFGKNVMWFRAGAEDLKEVLSQDVRDFKKEFEGLLEQKKENGNIGTAIDCLIDFAIAKKASDIHIEPTRGDATIRFRIDGILHEVLTVGRDMYPAIIARLKILANMKIDEYRHPQDGRIEPERLSDISLRVSTIPTLYGEKMALRLLNDSQKKLEIKNLGFSDEHAAIIMRNIEKPYGMIVASGPTGSGKTTTLYALLSLLQKDGINIMTLEDPIEQALGGVNQMQVHPRIGLTFASGLRAILRQDPDVILVGEIRDTETMQMATNAALTGHLVFTTLHTNDAPSALTRFLEMKVEDFVVASTVNLVIGQRLVRRVCDKCATEEKLDDTLMKKIATRNDVVAALSHSGETLATLAKKKIKVGKGCDACLGTGYRDRIGIYEILEPDRETAELVLKHAPATRIREAAEKKGFHDMITDGIKKVLAGETTFEEVLRTTKS